MDNFELLLDRFYFTKEYTIGKLYVDGKYFCDTIEDTNRDINQDGKLDTPKIQDETAIPFGRYKVIVSMSPHFKRMLPRILNVPGFDGILMHNGVNQDSTSGCIVMGENKVKGHVTNGTYYMNKLTNLLIEVQKTKTIYITIK